MATTTVTLTADQIRLAAARASAPTDLEREYRGHQSEARAERIDDVRAAIADHDHAYPDHRWQASEPAHVGLVADKLAAEELPRLMRGEDLEAAGLPDEVWRHLGGFLLGHDDPGAEGGIRYDFPEFRTIAPYKFIFDFDRRPIFERDGPLTSVVIVRAAPVTDRERALWRGSEVPFFRLTISLPAWMLAEEHERARALHAALCTIGVSRERPIKRKPDIQAHAATLGRYGVSGPREASAVAHAVAHPSTTARLRSFGFEGGQGVLFGARAGTAPAEPPREPRPSEVAEELARQTRPARQRGGRVGRDAAAGRD